MAITTGFPNILGILALGYSTRTENTSSAYYASLLGNKKEKLRTVNGMEIFPILGLVAETKTKTLSCIITDLRNRRLARIRKDIFKELLKSPGILCRYFCRWSFATWDVLLPSEKLAGSNVTTKNFWLQLEYKGIRQIRITACSVPVQLNGDVIAAYMSAYGNVKEVTMVRSADRTAHSDCTQMSEQDWCKPLLVGQHWHVHDFMRECLFDLT